MAAAFNPVTRTFNAEALAEINALRVALDFPGAYAKVAELVKPHVGADIEIAQSYLFMVVAEHINTVTSSGLRITDSRRGSRRVVIGLRIGTPQGDAEEEAQGRDRGVHGRRRSALRSHVHLVAPPLVPPAN
jgi:hypothetical protein